MSVEPKPAAAASMGELMSQLSSQTSRLIRDEMRLAQKEFLESAKHAGLGAGLFSVAGLLAFFGLATMALLIAVLVAAFVGRGQAQEVTPTAPRTVETVKADIQELKDARHDRN